MIRTEIRDARAPGMLSSQRAGVLACSCNRNQRPLQSIHLPKATQLTMSATFRRISGCSIPKRWPMWSTPRKWPTMTDACLPASPAASSSSMGSLAMT